MAWCSVKKEHRDFTFYLYLNIQFSKKLTSLLWQVLELKRSPPPPTVCWGCWPTGTHQGQWKKDLSAGRKACCCATMSTINPTWTVMGLNPDFQDEKPSVSTFWPCRNLLYFLHSYITCCRIWTFFITRNTKPWQLVDREAPVPLNRSDKRNKTELTLTSRPQTLKTTVNNFVPPVSLE
jgi:hypothetical protein